MGAKLREEDYVGKKYGKFTITSLLQHKNRTYAECRCDCGEIRLVCPCNLKNGKWLGCGCEREKHDGTYPRLYRIWNNMKSRCYNPKYHRYNYYGALGIEICKEWMKFSNFKSWALKNGYSDSLSLDRIDGSKTLRGYSPENCRWVNQYIQTRNSKRTKSNTGIRGISYVKSKNKYVVRIKAYKISHHIGNYDTLAEATEARRAAEDKYWGDER